MSQSIDYFTKTSRTVKNLDTFIYTLVQMRMYRLAPLRSVAIGAFLVLTNGVTPK